MGKRGPKPKPKALVILDGNAGRKPIIPDELEVRCDMPAVKPDIVALDDVASAEWDRVLAAMPPNLCNALDVNVLAQYALAWSILAQCQHEIRENGLTAWRESGPSVAPSFTMWKAATETLLKCGDRLGLNPSTRSRLQMPARGDGPEKHSGGRFAELLGRK